jgi:hypothetical protein
VLGVEPKHSAESVTLVPFPDPALPDFRERYLLREILRKYQGFDLGVDRRAAALKSLHESEVTNVVTNERVRNRDYGEDPRVREVYHLSCRKAISVLGRFSWKRFVESVRFGPGATTESSRKGGIQQKLLQNYLESTSSAAPLVGAILTESRAGWLELAKDDADTPVFEIGIRESEIFDTAPKNAWSDRTTLRQPGGNLILQLALGQCIRACLLREGVNLQDQTINQRLCRVASRTGRDATVDFSNASNSITEMVVWDHLGNHLWKGREPGEEAGVDGRWWQLADALRTTSYAVDNTERPHQLFSAMGNGFTFELESLIFYSLAWATCKVLELRADSLSVFGDDVIIPVEAVPLYRSVCAFAGLAFNDAKTHAETGEHQFRESCGKHYLNGVDVTPVYCQKPLVTVDQIVLLANNLLRWSVGFEPGFGRDGRLKPVYDWVVSHLPQKVRDSAIPWGEANDGLIKDFDEATPSVAILPKTTVKQTFPCSGGMCFAACIGGWCMGVRDLQLDEMRLGYRARSVRLVHRVKPTDGVGGLLEWLYRHSYTKISLPRDPLKWPWNPPEPPDTPGKVSLVFMERVVPHWTYIGPWVYEV